MKNKKIALVICTILFIYFVGGIFYNCIYKEVKKAKVDNGIAIKNYNYILYKKDSELYKKEFEILKKNLESNKINYEEYAKSISKMFIIDLYSIKQKKNMYDVGGTEFIYPESVENYKLNVQNTLYRFVQDNSDGKRKQELPEVKEVTIKEIEETKFKITDKKYDAYKIKVDIEYVKDLKYDKKAEIILIKDENYLHIVEKN